MRVLHIINALYVGGAEKLISFLLPALRERGVDAELLLLEQGDATMYNSLRAKGIKIICLNNGLRSVRNIHQVYEIIDKGHYDIVHAHLFPTQYYATFAKLRLGGRIKLVFTEHSTSNRRFSSPFFSIINRRMYLPLDQLVCITNEIKDLYISYQPKLNEKITVIHNGLPINEIANAKPIDLGSVVPNSNSKNKYILQVAGFRPSKDQETLIKALKFLPSNFICLFAGDGVRRPLCEEIAKQCAVENRVFFLGNRSDIYSLQRSVDYMVLSTHYEGLSLSCIEGMASGKPFLASAVKGVRNLVGGAGVLFQESNPEELASDILRLENDEPFRLRVINSCQSRASEFSIETCAKEHMELYRKLMYY